MGHWRIPVEEVIMEMYVFGFFVGWVWGMLFFYAGTMWQKHKNSSARSDWTKKHIRYKDQP